MRKIVVGQKDGMGEATSAWMQHPVVRPARIKPAALSLEVRSGQTPHRKFNVFGAQDEEECDRFIPFYAPPAHYSFTLRDPYST
jgi:hypothetical protein